MVHHLVHGDLCGILSAEYDHAQRVTNQKAVDTSTINEARGCVVICRYHRDRLPACIFAPQLVKPKLGGRAPLFNGAGGVLSPLCLFVWQAVARARITWRGCGFLWQ